MGEPAVRLTGSEWNVLACLWEKSPQSVMQLVGELEHRVGWSKSTTITTLRRMEDKGLIHSQSAGRGKLYVPAVDQEQAVVAETRSFLRRVYQGSVGLMMSSMARRQELTQEDLEQLRAILADADREEPPCS
ncbi:BlaI/MecI/CopY family transcriptional regulator [Flavonifractor hominis]|uniref:BlaI/MecI/CopY family transcriptional regulator n=1 Tax=Flavonifractor hominis TaxID=3133178 RepID=A0ABV1ET90_9FIRM